MAAIVDAGSVSQRVVIDTVTLDPPGEAKPARTVEEALQACDSGAAVCPSKPIAGQVKLALVSAPAPATIQADGSTDPWLKRTLAYVVVFDGEVCAPSGPLASGGTSNPCQLISIIDATTAKGLFLLEVGVAEPAADQEHP